MNTVFNFYRYRNRKLRDRIEDELKVTRLARGRTGAGTRSVCSPATRPRPTQKPHCWWRPPPVPPQLSLATAPSGRRGEGTHTHLQKQPHHLCLAVQRSLVECCAGLGLAVDLDPSSKQLPVVWGGASCRGDRGQERKQIARGCWESDPEPERRGPQGRALMGHHPFRRKGMRKWGGAVGT